MLTHSPEKISFSNITSEDVSGISRCCNAASSQLERGKHNYFSSWLKSPSKSVTPSLPSSSPLHESTSAGDSDGNRENLSDATSATVNNSSANEELTPSSAIGVLPSSPSFSHFREFRGVQNLKHLWNKRISAIRDTKTQSSNDNENSKLNKKIKDRTKSIGCLVITPPAKSVTETQPPPYRDSDANGHLLSKNKRAQSLYDCSRALDDDNSSNFVIDTFHRKRDNFYKYKTAAAAQALHNHSGESSECVITTIPVGIKTTNCNFPAVGRTTQGERIHWMKRDDIIITAKKRPTSSEDFKEELQSIQNEKNIIPEVSVTDIMALQEQQTSTIDDDVSCSQQLLSDTEPKTENVTSISNNSPLRGNVNAASLPSSNSTNSLKSTRSGDSLSMTRARKNANPARKYSFKTHAKNYHSSRKMLTTSTSFTSKQQESGSGATPVITNGNMVAKLTQQFNEIIQKDKKLLNEVKRKNGILMSRGGHVYKVVENTQSVSGTGRQILANKHLCTQSNGCTANATPPSSFVGAAGSTVRQNIRKFEDCVEKPKIPLKSNQVISKRKELTANNAPRGNVCKRLDSIKNLELKTQPTLEEIKEETKTPQDVEEKSLEMDRLLSPISQIAIETPQKCDSGNECGIFDQKVSEKEPATEEIFKTPREPPEGQEDQCDHIDQRPVTAAEKIGSNDPDCSLQDGEIQNVAEEIIDEEKMKQRKYRYSKIYEKIRFRTKKSQSPSPLLSPQKANTDIVNQVDSFENHHPEAKILDALEEVNRKLKGLSSGKPFLFAENDDFEQRILPNQSFIFQLNAKSSDNDILEEQINVVEALNTALVDTIGVHPPLDEEVCNSEVDDDMMNTSTSTEPHLLQPVSESTQDPPAENIKQQQLIGEIYEMMELVTTGKEEGTNDNVVTGVASTDADDIYQSVEDKKNSAIDDYESIAGSSCEQQKLVQTHQSDDGYEICEPPPSPSLLEVIPKSADSLQLNPASPPVPVRNTTDELPELPKPKRILPKSSSADTTVNLVQQTVPIVADSTLTRDPLDDAIREHHYYADEENIYDTIKGSHCYESLQSRCHNASEQKSLDSVSIISNCYESISNYRRALQPPSLSSTIALQKAGSTSTISSDQKTNSLYGVSLPLVGGVGGSNSSGLNNPVILSDNSDEWVDISDSEASPCGFSIAKQQFIVIRERSKPHRSPDWSKRVRDQRLQKSISYFEDDSDHYYEPLFPLGNKRHSSYTSEKNTHHKRNQDLPNYVPKHGKHASSSSSSLSHLRASGGGGNRIVDDCDDSFDTDADDIYETEENLKNQNDSGVDIRKLPDPPHSTNQVYAFVKRVKNFIANKKSPTSVGNNNNNNNNKIGNGGGQHKIYENSTQFYVDGNEYQNTPKAPHRSKSVAKSIKKFSSPSVKEDFDGGDYENTDFHNIPTIADTSNVKLSDSEKSLIAEGFNELATTTTTTATIRSKSKSGKSFKSRLRKSLVGTTFDAGTLITTRSTFYVSDDIMNDGCGELDSGFSEKGDFNGNSKTDTLTAIGNHQSFTTIARKTKGESSGLLGSHRRRTIIGIRPNDPPPPPPDNDQGKSLNCRSPTTSWYAECGVFKTGTSAVHQMNDANDVGKSLNLIGNMTSIGGGSTTTTTTSWYTEAGLYQTSGASVSSSGSSGVSTGNEASPTDDMMPHSMFLNEPLYQIYSAAKLESISRDMNDNEGSTDGYEEIGQTDNFSSCADADGQKGTRPSALQLVGPKYGPSRTLWSEIPEVINSVILPTLTPRERGLQEAKFEVITSEASYLKSLNLLRSHFMNHPVFRDTSIVSARDRKSLFSHIVPVHECSERLLHELEACWQDNIMLLGLSKKIYNTAEKHFHVYISFCEYQGRMDRTLRHLKEAKGLFSQNLDLLESSPVCCGLNLHSFLMLPMQRITRLPLLIDAVFSKLNPNDDEYENWKMTLAIMNKIVAQCNEAANRCEQAYEIERISRQLEFPSTIRALAIAPAGVPAQGSKPRFLVKKGELTHLVWRGDDSKLTFGKKFTKTNIYAFLFSDLLVLTKRKAEQLFQVFDYCPRNMLTISSGDILPQLPTKDMNQTGKNLILMTLLENNERKTVELVLSCPSVSEQERWLQAMRPPEAETPGEKLYEQWDCPQVIATHVYEAKEPDLLSLEIGDVVNVSRKLPDGWYQGERIRDGCIGWFPGDFTEEVNSAHVRARNLKQRYRLLTFTASYLESQKRK